MQSVSGPPSDKSIVVGENACSSLPSTRGDNTCILWQGSTETFTFFVTSSNNSQVYFAIHLLKRPLRPRPLRRPAATISGTSSTGTVGPSTASNDSSSNGPPLPVGARPGDIMLGEGFVDLMALFSVDHGTYTREDRKGNTRKVVVPMRNPITKRYVWAPVRWAVRTYFMS